MGRILALDYGSKRIGVAATDEAKTIALPKPFLSRSEPARLLELVRESDPELILLGLPKNLSGQETQAAQAVKTFGAWLKEQTGKPVEYVDERFSTREAKTLLTNDQMKQKDHKFLIDSVSALVLLQAYLRKS